MMSGWGSQKIMQQLRRKKALRENKVIKKISEILDVTWVLSSEYLSWKLEVFLKLEMVSLLEDIL